MSDDVVTFMSYAHDDDLILSSDPDELGFVSFLDQQLRLKLRDLGARQANVCAIAAASARPISSRTLSTTGSSGPHFSSSSCRRTGCSARIAARSSKLSSACARPRASRIQRLECLSWAKAMSIAAVARPNCKGRKGSCSSRAMTRMTSARSRPSSIAASATTDSTPNSTISRADCKSA
jgi:hypothetical protein